VKLWHQISYSLGLLSGTSDEELMSLVKGSNHQGAFRALFERHHYAVYLRLIRMGCPSMIAQEIVQDVFLSVFRARETYKEESAFRPWITVMARNRLIDLYRSRAIAYDLDLGNQDFIDETQEIEAHFIHKEKIEMLEASLASLKLSERELITLWLDDFSYEEMSNIVGKSISAVKFALHHAKKNLIKIAQNGVSDEK